MAPQPSFDRKTTYTNPVYPGTFADPFVLRHENGYTAFGTAPAVDGRPFPTLQSDDLVHWTPGPGALIPPEGFEGGDFWAPEVAYRDGRFLMVYSVGGENHVGHGLRVATSERPEGPYRDAGRPLLDPAKAPFAIDAHPFLDADGRWHLFYARDLLDSDRPGTSLVVAPWDDPFRLPDEFHVVARAAHDWQLYQRDRPMPQYDARLFEWHTLEGPFVVPHDGKLVLLYSGGNFGDETYGVDFLVADSVYGEYRDTNDGTGARVLRTVAGRVIGPGHNSVVKGPDGQDWMVYHAWDLEGHGRHLCVDPLDWTEDGPRCVPTWTPQTF